MKKFLGGIFCFLTLLVLLSFEVLAYDNLCWIVGGFPLRVAAIRVGQVGATQIYTVSGFGTNTGVPITGTIVVPPSGDIKFSFEILAASPTQYSVVHEMSLDRNTLNGTTVWRWQDGSYEGTDSVTFVPCSSLSFTTEKANKASQGLK